MIPTSSQSFDRRQKKLNLFLQLFPTFKSHFLWHTFHTNYKFENSPTDKIVANRFISTQLKPLSITPPWNPRGFKGSLWLLWVPSYSIVTKKIKSLPLIFSLLQIIFSLNTFHTDSKFENPPIDYNPFPRKRTQVLVQ